ncbi:hypothetical protein ACRRTK_004314 [Alexandromys fortis]
MQPAPPPRAKKEDRGTRCGPSCCPEHVGVGLTKTLESLQELLQACPFSREGSEAAASDPS